MVVPREGRPQVALVSGEKGRTPSGSVFPELSQTGILVFIFQNVVLGPHLRKPAKSPRCVKHKSLFWAVSLRGNCRRSVFYKERKCHVELVSSSCPRPATKGTRPRGLHSGPHAAPCDQNL